MSTKEIKLVVKEKYAEAARQAQSGSASCCGSGSSTCDPITSNLYSSGETGELPESAVRASLGCGNPTALAELKAGEVVLDLGSGGGIDVLLSAKRVGPAGKAYGLDMTDEMLALARENQKKAGVRNAEFLKGEIERIPLPDASVDVIISNCVINLSADKDQVLREAFRVLKPGGRFAVSDVVTRGSIPAEVRANVLLWVGCVAGALEEGEYRAKLAASGFERIDIEPTRIYRAEDARSFLEDKGMDVDAVGREMDGRIFSAFIRAAKPAREHDCVPPMEITSLHAVSEQLARATAATKCHPCGCFRDTIEALSKASGLPVELRPALEGARRVLSAKRYECLGCSVCFPAVAANAFAEAFPGAMPDAAFCPAEPAAERPGWPPLPGDYAVVRFAAPVAVCTLNDDALAKELAAMAPEGLAIVGTLRTENLGIERVIRNVLANPNIRFLVLCGEDSQQLVGHFAGQSMESLFANGVDDKQRIVGAKGRRPFVKNVDVRHIEIFRKQVQLVSIIGDQDAERIARAIADCHAQGLAPFGDAIDDIAVETVRAKEPQFYTSDPAGFLVVYPDRRARDLVVEHYTNGGTLDCVVAGATPAAVYAEIVKRRLVSQLDHAAYLGCELAKAEHSLKSGDAYVQDRAPGIPRPEQADATANCGPGCNSCH